jgi:hypothetical protein
MCEEFHDVRNKNCRIHQQKMKKTKSTKIDEISFFSVKQTSIKFVVMLCSSSFKTSLSLSNVKREELLASQNDFQNDSQNDFQNDSQNRISSLESASESASESDSCSFAVVSVLNDLFAVTFVDAFIQYSMIFFMISSTHLD